MKIPGFQLSARQLIIILVVAMIIRFFCAGMPPLITVDSKAYYTCAMALLSGDLGSFYVERTPGYPLILMLVMALTQETSPEALTQPLLILQSILGCLSALLAGDIFYRLFQNRLWAVSVGILCAVSPALLHYEHAFLTEAVYTFSLLLYVRLLVGCWQNRNSPQPPNMLACMVLGLLTGWLMWIKPIAMAVGFGTILFLVLIRPQINPQHFQKIAIGYLAGWMLLVVPWISFNWVTHQTITFAASSGANQLYKTIDWVDWKSPQEAEYKTLLLQRYPVQPKEKSYRAVNDAHVIMYERDRQVKGYSEIYLAHDNAARNISNEVILNHPVQYLVITLQEFFKFVTQPLGDAVDIGHIVWQAVFLFSLIGMALLLLTPSISLLQRFPMILAGMHWVLYPLLTISDPRYRVPLEPLFMMIAVYGAMRLWATYQTTDQRHPQEVV